MDLAPIDFLRFHEKNDTKHGILRVKINKIIKKLICII